LITVSLIKVLKPITATRFNLILYTKQLYLMEGFIGEIRLFAGNFAPRGWALCQGQLLPINQNQALFSILGTNYGGNGVATFGLPDLRGRVPIGVGQGPGLPNFHEGEMGGSSDTTLTNAQLPMHTHAIKVSNQFSGGDHPASKYLGASASDKGFYADSGNTTMAPDAITPAGSNLPFSNLQPYLALNYIICIYGEFPSRA
jgi:microcystin-dependent protein